MQDRLINRRDLDFVLYELLDIESLSARARFADHSARDLRRGASTLRSRSPTEHFAPHNRKADENEPTFDGQRVHMIPEVKAALDAFCDAGLHGRHARTTSWAACSCR